ncbi:MAG: serine/threonine-protein kinase [Candidatus Obscuribacterales bacterium]
MSQFLTDLDTKWCDQCSLFYSNESKLCPVHSAILIKVKPALRSGDMIDGKYAIVSTISEGGWGSVYRARREDMERDVAIKVLHEHLSVDENASKRFLREAKALNQLRHPSLTRVFAFGYLETRQPYFAMDYIEGPSLEALIKKKGYLTAEQTIAIFIDVCAALEEVHAAGVVHRDLKPSNIILKEEGDRTIPIIVDFGLVAFDRSGSGMTTNLTKTGLVLGTPRYMSPEQCRGLPSDARSDIYSLGCTMYEALTGKPPFYSKNIMQLMAMHLQEQPAEVAIRCDTPEVGEALADCVMQCLGKDAKRRPQSADELQAMLQEAAKGNNIAARRDDPIDVRTPAPPVRGDDRSAEKQDNSMPLLSPAAVLVILVLVIAGGAGWSAIQNLAEQHRQNLIKEELAKRPEVQGTLLSINRATAGGQELHIRATDGTVRRVTTPGEYQTRVRKLVPGQSITVRTEVNSNHVDSIGKPEASASNEDVQAAYQSIITAFDLIYAGEDFSDGGNLRLLLSNKLIRLSEQERTKLFDPGNLKTSIEKLPVYGGDPDLHDPQAVVTFRDFGAIRFANRKDLDSMVFLFDKAPFYNHSKDKVAITMVRSPERGNWVIDSIVPVSDKQWDQL